MNFEDLDIIKGINKELALNKQEYCALAANFSRFVANQAVYSRVGYSLEMNDSVKQILRGYTEGAESDRKNEAAMRQLFRLVAEMQSKVIEVKRAVAQIPVMNEAKENMVFAAEKVLIRQAKIEIRRLLSRNVSSFLTFALMK